MKSAVVVIVFVVGLFLPVLVDVIAPLPRGVGFPVGLGWGVLWVSLFFGPLQDLFRKWRLLP